MEPRSFSYESMGSTWKISVWDAVDTGVFADIEKEMIAESQAFDQTYSRFIKTSLVWELAHKTGTVTVPKDLTAMLRHYQKLHALSGGTCTPLIGFTLSDMGYDADYSLEPKSDVRSPPPLPEAITIIDDVTIEITQPALIDVGALGKGYFVDKLASMLRRRGLRHFLVDGSGDIFYEGNGEPMRAGLEHPGDASKVIGVLEFKKGGFCASGVNRRAWRGYHHIIDPLSLTSPKGIIATWVLADSATLADGLATCLFLAEPERFLKECAFHYCILHDDYTVKCSAGFPAELF